MLKRPKELGTAGEEDGLDDDIVVALSTDGRSRYEYWTPLPATQQNSALVSTVLLKRQTTQLPATQQNSAYNTCV